MPEGSRGKAQHHLPLAELEAAIARQRGWTEDKPGLWAPPWSGPDCDALGGEHRDHAYPFTRCPALAMVLLKELRGGVALVPGGRLGKLEAAPRWEAWPGPCRPGVIDDRRARAAPELEEAVARAWWACFGEGGNNDDGPT